MRTISETESWSVVAFQWYDEPVPDGLPVRQVYGHCFDRWGRLLVRVDGTSYGLPGGRPEPEDIDMVATLVRECREEVNIDVSHPVYLGYQRVTHDTRRRPYAQVRMAALIDRVGPSRPDPDNGRTYRRLLTSVHRARDLLDWGEHGRLQLLAAARVASDVFSLPVSTPAADAYV